MGIVDLIFPKFCSGCGAEGQYICAPCRKTLIRPEMICPMCCKASLDGWTHPRCRKWDGMERLIVGLPYKGVVQQCFKKVKYKSAWEIIKYLYNLCELGEMESSVVTSVPMWSEKEKTRGFNQAELLAQLIAEKNKVPCLACLERSRETKPMFGLKRRERIANVEGAFQLNPKSQILKFSNGEKVIIVDDVWTTGATMRECARVLKEYGVKEVWGVALSR